MGKTIIIVHPAEIVCRGLASMLEDLREVRIFYFASYSEIRYNEHILGQKLLLFVPVKCSLSNELLNLRTQAGEHLLVGLLENEMTEKHQQILDYIFPLEKPQKEFLKLAEDFFELNVSAQNDELTNREKEVLRLIALGYTNKAIAESLYISTHTVISHRKNITEKLGIKSVSGLTVYAIIQKIVDHTGISPNQLL